MNGWQVLKIALDYYWAFMKDNELIGALMTVAVVNQITTLIRGQRPTQINIGRPPEPPRIRAAPRSVAPPAASPPSQEGQSRYDVLLDDNKD